MLQVRDILNRRIIKFGVTSLAGLIVNVSILVLLVEVVRLPEWMGGAISMALTPVLIFPFVNNWVFDSELVDINIVVQLQRFVGYYTSIMASKLVNYVIFIVLITIDVWYPISWAIGSIATFLFTYSVNNLIYNKTDYKV